MANPKNPDDGLVGKLIAEMQSGRLGAGAPEGAPLGAPDPRPLTVKSYEIEGLFKNLIKTRQPRDIDPVLAPKREAGPVEAASMQDLSAYQQYRQIQMQEAQAYQKQINQMQSYERDLLEQRWQRQAEQADMKTSMILTAQDLERAKEAAPQAFIKRIEEEQQKLEDSVFEGLLGAPRSEAAQSLKLSIRQELLLRSISAVLDAFETPRADRNAIMEAVTFLLRGIKPDLERLSEGPSSGPPRRIDLDL